MSQPREGGGLIGWLMAAKADGRIKDYFVELRDDHAALVLTIRPVRYAQFIECDLGLEGLSAGELQRTYFGIDPGFPELPPADPKGQKS